MSTSSAEMVATVDGLSRRFGRQDALRNVSLNIPRGGVFGLVGLNGAGKTTLIKHLLGLYRATSGTVRVQGVDPSERPEVALARVGYMSDDDQLPGWMRVAQLAHFYRAFYPQWDDDYASELMTMFQLDPTARLKTLSKGQRARAGLLIALAHRPELLILDEPSSGLDPLVRGDILEAIVKAIADEGRTVLFSSHLLDEVDRVADRVAVIHQGEVLYDDELIALKDRFRRVGFHFEQPTTPEDLAGVCGWRGSDNSWSALVDLEKTAPERLASQWGAAVDDIHEVSLHELFVSTLREASGSVALDQTNRVDDNKMVTS